jgi:hypothetical protein
MDNNSTLINKRVKVLAIYSEDKDGRSICVPKRMVYKGREHDFTEVGLVHPTTKGHRMIHVFDMTDGSADYRLEFDAEGLNWTLVSISDNGYGL